MVNRKPFLLVCEPDGFPREVLHILKNHVRIIFGSRSRKELLLKAKGCQLLWVRLDHFIDKKVFDSCPQLQCIISPTTGLTHIDLSAATNAGVSVLSLKGETQFLKSVTSTAEFTIGLILALIRQIPVAHADVLKGHWGRNQFVGRQTSSMVLGIVGLGRIGQMVARTGKTLFKEVISYDIKPNVRYPGVPKVSFAQLLNKSDVVTIHIPESLDNQKFFNKSVFSRMKNGSILINTSRGSIIDEKALINALHKKLLMGAALDVIDNEPQQTHQLKSNRLIQYALGHSNLLLTPHLGGATTDSLKATEIFMGHKLLNYLKSMR